MFVMFKFMERCRTKRAGVSVHISSEVRAISALNSALEVKAMRGGLADSASAERCTKSIPPTQDLPTATGDGKGFFIDDFRYLNFIPGRLSKGETPRQVRISAYTDGVFG